jgi:hypothetical protein
MGATEGVQNLITPGLKIGKYIKPGFVLGTGIACNIVYIAVLMPPHQHGLQEVGPA